MQDNLLFRNAVNLNASITASLNDKTIELQERGQSVINLTMGEANTTIPENIQKAAIDAIRDNKIKYTKADGMDLLKEAIIKKLHRENNLRYQSSQITVGAGAKQVIFFALMATINPGDEVIIPTPYWPTYPEMVSLLGGINTIVQTKSINNFKLQPIELEQAITKNTKWLILNSPNNPSGISYTFEDLEKLANVLIHYPQVLILSDNVYEHILYDSIKHYNIAQVEPLMYDRTFTVSGLSKSYAMTGWRLGYGAGSQNIINTIGKIISQSSGNPNTISQFAALEALNNSQDIFKKNISILNERRNLVANILSQVNNIEYNIPQGTFYFFINIENLIGSKCSDGEIIKDSSDFTIKLLEEEQVATIPGIAFGIENYFRLSFSNVTIEDLEKACRKIVKFINTLRYL